MQSCPLPLPLTILSDPIEMMQPLANIPPAMIHPIGLIDAIGLMQPLGELAIRPTGRPTTPGLMQPFPAKPAIRPSLVRTIENGQQTWLVKRHTKTNWGRLEHG